MITLLIKPASGRCQLRCRYCFYHDLCGLRDVSDRGVMAPDTLESLVRLALAPGERGPVTFAFQGGEPTLAGRPFFEALLSCQHRWNTAGVPIQNSIQTNGLLLDDEWIRFLARERFLVGLSLDGPKEIHDRYRVDARGRGTFRETLRRYDDLRKAGAMVNVLSVVTDHAARHVRSLHRFYHDIGVEYLQFIPMLPPFGDTPLPEDAPRLGADRYAGYLMEMFDLWWEDLQGNRAFRVRTFDNLVQMAAGHPPESCDMNGFCSPHLVVEADGSLYPCDFYCLDEVRLGSLREIAQGRHGDPATFRLQSLATCEAAARFVAPSLVPDPACDACPHAGLCRGGCRRQRDSLGLGPLERNRFCDAYRAFFDHAAPRILRLAARLSYRL